MNEGPATEYFKRLEESILAQAKASGILVSSTAKGRAREGLLAAFLADHLPERITVESGEVIDSSGASSGEADIILVDHNNQAHRVGGEAVVPVEAAVGVIEVKSTLNASELESAVKKIARAKKLKRSQHHGFFRHSGDGRARVAVPPVSTNGYIVGLAGNSLASLNDQLSAHPEWCESDFLRFGPEIITVLGSGMSYKNDMTIYRPSETHEHYTLIMVDFVSGLGEIIHHVQETVNRYGGMTYDLGGYY